MSSCWCFGIYVVHNTIKRAVSWEEAFMNYGVGFLFSIYFHGREDVVDVTHSPFFTLLENYSKMSGNTVLDLSYQFIIKLDPISISLQNNNKIVRIVIMTCVK